MRQCGYAENNNYHFEPFEWHCVDGSSTFPTNVDYFYVFFRRELRRFSIDFSRRLNVLYLFLLSFPDSHYRMD